MKKCIHLKCPYIDKSRPNNCSVHINVPSCSRSIVALEETELKTKGVCNCSMKQAIIDIQVKLIKEITEENDKLKSGIVKRFKNDCVSLFVHKYELDKKDMIEHMDCLTDEEYLDYIDGEYSTEDYIDEDISNWD